MATIRGLIKVEATGKAQGGSWLTDTLMNINDYFADTAPIASAFSDWLTGKRRSYQESQTQAAWQQQATYMKGGYLFYADDLELEYHGTNTDGFAGVGGNGSVETNAAPYRECKFKTTISQRDADLPVGAIEALRSGSTNPWDYISQSVQYQLDKMAGVTELKAYYKKRAHFLEDLKDVEVTTSSSMFFPIIGYIDCGKMTMQAGATEAQFELSAKEVTELAEANGKDTAHACSVEPGVGF